MASKDRRKFGTDLTNLVQNPKAKKRLTRKASQVKDAEDITSSRPSPKSSLAKRIAAKLKKPAGSARDSHHSANRLVQLSLDDARPTNRNVQPSSKNQAELPYVKIRTYSKKPGKQWAYVESSNKHVSFVNEPLDIEAWLNKDKENKRRSKKL